jgi:hypothetical protein
MVSLRVNMIDAYAVGAKLLHEGSIFTTLSRIN